MQKFIYDLNIFHCALSTKLHILPHLTIPEDIALDISLLYLTLVIQAYFLLLEMVIGTFRLSI